jgi:vWA-MoxR associated protein C-terminal domain/vWA-MoxR associated protein middle region 0
VPPTLPAEHRTIMVVDVADFTNPGRTEAHQIAVQEGMYKVLQAAFAASGIDWERCTVEHRGDGAMILIPPEVPKVLLVDPLPDRLAAGLREYNAVHSMEAALQLRVGLHAGEVHANSQGGVLSQAVILAFRILDATAAKEALRSSTGTVALIASDRFYRDVITQHPAADPVAYQRIPVAVKGLLTEAWLRLPGATAAVVIPNRQVDAVPVAPTALPESEADVLPVANLERLSDALSGVTVANLSTVVRRAAGPATPIPRSTDAWDVFRELADVNAGPDGIPPALLFLDLLATQVDEELRATLTELITGYARRLRLESALEARRKAAIPIPTEPRLHLLIAVVPKDTEEMPHHTGRYLLSYWRQDDPEEWPPIRGDDVEVTTDELERRVDEVVLAAERAWATQNARVTLEFLLPRELLRLPVHLWGKEHASGDPRPLRIDYPIVLRSLERMKTRYWHRVWRDRWQSLLQDPSPTRVHYGVPGDTGTPHRVAAILSDTRWVSMVLAEPPEPQKRPGPGCDELAAALRSGLPILFWHPDASPDALYEVIDRLVEGGGLADLPVRSQAARRAEFFPMSASININTVRDLVILWDDPTRVVALD